MIDEFNTDALRIGVHIIALPDDSSESAITIPEPAAIALLGLGGLFLMRRKRKALGSAFKVVLERSLLC